MSLSSRIVLAAMLLLVGARAQAQVSAPPALDDASRPRIRMRGISAAPTIALSNIGTDSNVFNTAEGNQGDFTLTLTPGMDAWARLGRARVSARGQSDLVYFRKFASERSVDGGGAIRIEFPTNRIVPWVGGTRYTGRQRLGYEIDARSRRTVGEITAGVNINLTPKSSVELSGRHQTTAWEGDAEFLGDSLSTSLDRLSNTAGIAFRQRLTVLTTLVAEGTTTKNRFQFAPTSNTDTTSVVVGFDLKARALIDGTARVGVIKFDSVGGGFESFSGLVTSADLGYILRGATRFAVQVGREPNYSFQHGYPYYIQTDGGLTINQRIIGRWDAQIKGSRASLSYRPLLGTTNVSYADHVESLGVGVGYRVNTGMRVGIDANRTRRTSERQIRGYEGFRIGGSVTYSR